MCSIIKNLCQTARNPSFIMVKIEKQKKGFVNCGVNTIAAATSLAFGIDPTDFSFKQDATRSYLIHSFEMKQLCMFPREHQS